MNGLVLTGSWSGIVAAIGALASLLTAVAAFRRVGQVHVLVNSKMSALLEWNRRLVQKLTDEDIELPDSEEESS
jgi:hypothetical protein